MIQALRDGLATLKLWLGLYGAIAPDDEINNTTNPSYARIVDDSESE